MVHTWESQSLAFCEEPAEHTWRVYFYCLLLVAAFEYVVVHTCYWVPGVLFQGKKLAGQIARGLSRWHRHLVKQQQDTSVEYDSWLKGPDAPARMPVEGYLELKQLFYEETDFLVFHHRRKDAFGAWNFFRGRVTTTMKWNSTVRVVVPVVFVEED